MQVDVYQTDAEAFEATAAAAAGILRDVTGRPPTVALPGGRSGRGVMVALAARSDVPWEGVEWWWGDERWVEPDDPRSNVRVARDSLLVPRGIAAERIHPPPLALRDPERIAAAYAEAFGAGSVFDLVLLGMGTNGHVASLMPGCSALRATAPYAAVPLEEVSEEPRVPRVTVTPPVLAAARHVLVTVVGAAKARIVVAALRGPAEPSRVPAHLVRPSDRVRWLLDRAAAADLLRDARPAADAQ